ncbi:hypothetical protein [Chitinilyticum piscinae]|uniref:Uncharacterized protein n=1 Tax=Chitinilyticum piscinae TaxID=2866724 RepID=A0A8J7FIB3_9NEIS|nr:hypothetical protein [Chitinilyticum piscinae]MBE9607902.1 hypothetical protein [Chitinilyticum piscinae]
MGEVALDWFAALRRDCVYIEALSDAAAAPDDYPAALRAFLQHFGVQDIDGLLIGGDACLNPESAVAEALRRQNLRPFARERYGLDYFSLTSEDRVVRWFHDGERTGRMLAPDFTRFLLHRCLLLCDRAEAFGEGEAAALLAESWAVFLRRQLGEAGADLTDPWWPLWPDAASGAGG